ncbi:MAG: CapA family protein [Candidatus Cohnella colombiensis]|uniref:CapA family protein n=1 Tax=Candidatus Cohnella colombiensis TaxID=3121368 RepID=A0AA95EZD3_9BACL|nr:MAG: CapA family protein [Cohnella sp.]
MRKVSLGINLGLLVLMLTACSSLSPVSVSTLATNNPIHTEEATATSSPLHTQQEPSPSPTPIVTEASLLAVGDIMVHSPQLPAYYNAETKDYHFNAWFDQVKQIFAEGDWVVGNLETPLAGEDLKYSGYPRFNAPAQLAEALVNAGVNLVSTANNHTMDRGFPGVERTLNNVKAAGLIPVGSAATKEESEQQVIVERNGIQMGFLAYSYGTNGIPVPADKPFAINLIDKDKIVSDIVALRASGVDLVTVSLHFGNEYQRMPSDGQIDLAHSLVAAGADLILGSHPHVVQPYDEIIIPADESIDGTERRGLVIYSLGNFISNQSGDWKDVGLIFGVTFTKTVEPDGTSRVEWHTVKTIPTWVHIFTKNKLRYYTVIPLEQALTTRDDPTLTTEDYSNMEKKLASINEHLLRLQ